MQATDISGRNARRTPTPCIQWPDASFRRCRMFFFVLIFGGHTGYAQIQIDSRIAFFLIDKDMRLLLPILTFESDGIMVSPT